MECTDSIKNQIYVGIDEISKFVFKKKEKNKIDHRILYESIKFCFEYFFFIEVNNQPFTFKRMTFRKFRLDFCIMQ